MWIDGRKSKRVSAGDSARAGENVWTYKTAEGGIAETTPMKYMDGTPFLKRPENVPVPSELMPANAQGLPTSVEGMPSHPTVQTQHTQTHRHTHTHTHTHRQTQTHTRLAQ